MDVQWVFDRVEINRSSIYSELFIQGYLFRAYYNKGVNHCHLCFGRDSRADGGMGNIYSGEKGRLQEWPDWRLLA